ncbi:hypothetical protein [Prochlorococcus sp. MIT 1341]|uniref:hypothetical protein n=1 Tax=Prochlorococcus sp. MIT 1341 TaxID=3096221 RepID=UPI002A759989|nr:hypothetical protein [Prochlorococcus sp. MIT 1341]
MNRAQLVAPAIPNGTTEVKIIEKEWGIERCYKTQDGQVHCIPASFDSWLFDC